jgi:GNAT superfamily N-acetyltransferase
MAAVIIDRAPRAAGFEILATINVNMSFRKVSIKEIGAAHPAHPGVYEWLNAKGVRQWLHALSQATFAERRREGQLFAICLADGVAAAVTLAFGASAYWLETSDAKSRWWIKPLAAVRAWRGAGVGKRVMPECESAARSAKATEVYLDCVATGFLPPDHKDPGCEALADKEITHPSGHASRWFS